MRRSLFILLAFLLAVSCREPQSQEYFIKGIGPYVFTVDMSDTTVVYDFDLFTRLDIARPYEPDAIPAGMPLDIQWVSPSGARFRESVYLPLSAKVYEPYRAGVSPLEPGIWTVTLSVPAAPEGLQGMGLVVKKQAWDTEN